MPTTLMKKLESERREAGHHDAKGFVRVERPECVTSPVAEPEEHRPASKRIRSTPVARLRA
jgi:hypothetical protein